MNTLQSRHKDNTESRVSASVAGNVRNHVFSQVNHTLQLGRRISTAANTDLFCVDARCVIV